MRGGAHDPGEPATGADQGEPATSSAPGTAAPSKTLLGGINAVVRRFSGFSGAAVTCNSTSLAPALPRASAGGASTPAAQHQHNNCRTAERFLADAICSCQGGIDVVTYITKVAGAGTHLGTHLGVSISAKLDALRKPKKHK